MTTITQADIDAVNAFHSASLTALFGVGGSLNKAHTLLLEAFAAHREAAEARAREEGAKAMQTKAVEVAAWSHMVPPDGGSPSEDECAVARAAADAIAALDPAQITGANHDR